MLAYLYRKILSFGHSNRGLKHVQQLIVFAVGNAKLGLLLLALRMLHVILLVLGWEARNCQLVSLASSLCLLAKEFP